MADQEYLDLLTRGVEEWNQWKGDTSWVSPAPRWNLCYDADLIDADLSGVDLSGANLSKVELTGANFAGARLVGTCLAEAELVEANFAGADLNGADLSGANVCAADFSNADLRNADLSEADLSEACFHGANLTGANLSWADLDKARLHGANLNGANFSGVYSGSYLLEPYLHRAEIRSAKAAGAVMRPPNADRQGAEGCAGFSFKFKREAANSIILYTRITGRLLYLLGIALLFVSIGVGMLYSPENPGQVVMAIFIVLFFGLGLVIFLLQFLRQLFKRTPLLVINDEGIQYFYSYSLAAVEKNVMTRGSVMLKWKEVGAIGFVRMERTSFFAVYASARRWRSGWSPSLLLPLSLLPVSAKQLLALIQERYRMQMEAYHIENVEITDTSSFSRKKEKM